MYTYTVYTLGWIRLTVYLWRILNASVQFHKLNTWNHFRYNLLSLGLCMSYFMLYYYYIRYFALPNTHTNGIIEEREKMTFVRIYMLLVPKMLTPHSSTLFNIHRTHIDIAFLHINIDSIFYLFVLSVFYFSCSSVCRIFDNVSPALFPWEEPLSSVEINGIFFESCDVFKWQIVTKFMSFFGLIDCVLSMICDKQANAHFCQLIFFLRFPMDVKYAIRK